MLDPSPAPLSPDSAAIRAEAAAFVADQLRQAEAEFGIAVATDMVIGMVQALTTWSEDAVGISLADVLVKRNGGSDHAKQ
jgi:hypothetical protein